MEYAGEETEIRKDRFCFVGGLISNFNLTDDEIENDILRSFKSV